jgi:hypothetical protein
MGRPDFFLSTAGENQELSSPRACWAKGRLRDQVRDDYLLIEIEPPLIGQMYGLGDQDIIRLLLSTRFEGTSLFPFKDWPCHVFVARILDDVITKTLVFTLGQVELIAWGTIFRTLDDAAAYAQQLQMSFLNRAITRLRRPTRCRLLALPDTLQETLR